MVRNVCQGYFLAMETKEEGIPLAVLAARVTGNPHYFDKGQNAAVLLLHVLCHAGGREVPRDIAGIHEVYGDGGASRMRLQARWRFTDFICGDMDPEGIGIADRLWRKYPRNIRIWRMDGQDYLDALSEEQIEEWRLGKLQGLEHPLLPATAEHVRQVGRAAYQENILDWLAEDIMLLDVLKRRIEFCFLVESDPSFLRHTPPRLPIDIRM